MKFRIRSMMHRRQRRMDRLTKWHKTFAFWPRKLAAGSSETSTYIWLGIVMRRYAPAARLIDEYIAGSSYPILPPGMRYFPKFCMRHSVEYRDRKDLFVETLQGTKDETASADSLGNSQPSIRQLVGHGQYCLLPKIGDLSHTTDGEFIFDGTNWTRV